jgi:hypothetical protein
MPEPKGAAAVDAWIAGLEHPLKGVVAAVRAALAGSDPRLGEQIKWNAPSFTWDGEDRVTCNLRPKAPLLLIFHRGAKAKNNAGFAFADETGLMDWKAPDRAVVTIAREADWDARGNAIVALARRWMALA